jgi:hypothetical protein
MSSFGDLADPLEGGSCVQVGYPPVMSSLLTSKPSQGGPAYRLFRLLRVAETIGAGA